MRFFMTLMLVFGFAYFSIPAAVTHADEIDDMVEDLNSRFRERDKQGFASKFSEYSKDPNRFTGADYDKLGKTGSEAISIIEVYGSYLSHSNTKRHMCSNRIARVISVFFAKEGQYAVRYWFFKPQDKWRLAAFDVKGQGSTGAFMDELAKLSAQSC